MRVNSLAFRLFATAAAWTLLVLPIAGLIIYSLYRQEVANDFDQRLKYFLTIVQADSIDAGAIEPGGPGELGEPLFQLSNSGWYWQIKPLDNASGKVRTSPSLGKFTLPSPYETKVATDLFGYRWTTVDGPEHQRLRVVEVVYALSEDPTGPRYSFLVAGPLDWLDARVSAFRMRLAIALALAGIGLVAVTLFQVRFGLLPLRAIELGLAAIRSGQSQKLEGELPVEIQPLQHELNALIESNQSIVDRARTQVGNLAHALKTPLAVITNEAREDNSPLGLKVAEQAAVMRDQVSLYLDRARMTARAGGIGRIAEVRPVCDGLQRALERIYRERAIAIAVDCPADARFQGEKHDIEEMLGNLLDNGCKWARTAVRLQVQATAGDQKTTTPRLAITIDDDGPGLGDEQRKRLGKRGLRLDETKPGSGLGLSIVADLAQSYHGALELDASPLGGLRARLDLPAA